MFSRVTFHSQVDIFSRVTHFSRVKFFHGWHIFHVLLSPKYFYIRKACYRRFPWHCVFISISSITIIIDSFTQNSTEWNEEKLILKTIHRMKRRTFWCASRPTFSSTCSSKRSLKEKRGQNNFVTYFQYRIFFEDLKLGNLSRF
jgi:hypothetical protein